MHNHKGFAREIHQLKVSLKDAKNERELLKHQLKVFKRELESAGLEGRAG